MTTHTSFDSNYEPLAYPVSLSRVLATVERILVNYRFQDYSGIPLFGVLDSDPTSSISVMACSYGDTMENMVLLDLACVLNVNSQNNPDLAWMVKIQEDYKNVIDLADKNVIDLAESGSEDTEAAVRSMYADLIASRPENFDCQLEDHWAVLYDYYSPESTSVFKEN